MCVKQLSSILSILVIISVTIAEERIWKSKSGSNEVRAELVSATEHFVKLSTSAGKEIEVQRAKLSKKDQEYVSGWLATNPKHAKKQMSISLSQFYRSIRKDKKKMRALISKKSQISFDKQPEYFKFGAADKGTNPRITTIKFDKKKDKATANFGVKIGGDRKTMQALFAMENYVWKINGLVGLGSTDKIVMDFEKAKTSTIPRSD